MFTWRDDDLTVDLDALNGSDRDQYLSPRQQRRAEVEWPDIEWLGIIRRAGKPAGVLARLKGPRLLVQVSGRETHILTPRVAQAMSAALDEALRAALQRIEAS